MKKIILILSFIVISCGKNASIGPDLERSTPRASCDQKDGCNNKSYNWHIEFDKNFLPKNLSIVINDEIVFDSCIRDNKGIFTSRSNGVQFFDISDSVKLAKRVRLELVDRGINCNEDKTYFLDTEMKFKSAQSRNLVEVALLVQ